MVGRSCYLFQLNRNINCKWQFLDCSTVAFSERYVQFLNTLFNRKRVTRNNPHGSSCL